MSDQMMYGMQLSVVCSEDAAGLHVDDAMASSLLGNSLVDLMQAQCAVWPKGDDAEGFPRTARRRTCPHCCCPASSIR